MSTKKKEGLSPKTHKINIAFGQSSLRMGDEEMDMLTRIRHILEAEQGRRGIASIARQAIREMYEKHKDRMDVKTLNLRYRK